MTETGNGTMTAKGLVLSFVGAMSMGVALMIMATAVVFPSYQFFNGAFGIFDPFAFIALSLPLVAFGGHMLIEAGN